MKLGVLINFDQFIGQLFQNFILSSLSHPLNVISLNFKSHLLEMSL